MKKINVLFSFVLLAISVLFLVGCETASSDLQYLTIEINPGIEVILNANDEITEVNPLNEDGELLLVDLDLVGMNIEDAVEAIIDEATKLGYMNLEQVQNQVNIQAFGKDNETAVTLGDKVRTKVEATLQSRGISGVAAMKQVESADQTAAQNKGVDVAKYVMAQKILMEDPMLDVDELLEKPLKELIEIKQEQVREMKEIAISLRTAFHEELLPIINEYAPLIEALEAEIATLIANIAAEADATAKAALEVTLTEKQNELETLQLQFKDARDLVREEYLLVSTGMRSQIQNDYQNRVQEHQQAVNEFREDHPLPQKPNTSYRP